MALETPALNRVIAANPAERVLAPLRAATNRRPFVAVLVAAFVLHAVALGVIFYFDKREPLVVEGETEVPIEVIVEPPPPPPPPPQAKEEPPPPPPPPPQEKQAKKPPPPPKDDNKPAFDAPRDTTNAKLDKVSPDKETKTPTVAQQPQDGAPDPSTSKAPEAAAASQEDQAAALKPMDEKPDAEPLDKAAPPDLKAEPKPSPPKAKPQKPQNARADVAQQLAALAPVPNFSIANAAKPSPIGGGTEETTYKSILLGLIMKARRYPEAARQRHAEGAVLVGFWIDDRGNLTHQALYRSSGQPDLDAEAVAAVRRAAPFPVPPVGEPHGFVAQLVFQK